MMSSLQRIQRMIDDGNELIEAQRYKDAIVCLTRCLEESYQWVSQDGDGGSWASRNGGSGNDDQNRLSTHYTNRNGDGSHYDHLHEHHQAETNTTPAPPELFSYCSSHPRHNHDEDAAGTTSMAEGHAAEQGGRCEYNENQPPAQEADPSSTRMIDDSSRSTTTSSSATPTTTTPAPRAAAHSTRFEIPGMYRRPLKLKIPERMDAASRMDPFLYGAVIFNLALAHNLQGVAIMRTAAAATTASGEQRQCTKNPSATATSTNAVQNYSTTTTTRMMAHGYFQKAIKLYNLTLDVQSIQYDRSGHNSHEGNIMIDTASPSTFLAMASMNNVAMIYASLGFENEAKECFERIISLSIYILMNSQPDKVIPHFHDFFHNALAGESRLRAPAPAA
eukprot:CAMPEP_0119564526 /NCGR_PEP_ID=MMETSP1352-20130426/27262_1 /TAXON_ID=265584 /ORGANISM="Stauroneis constricta, Strain CCMP1120" /LENGTH=390 /DNA_ID=CAMNT_0007613293 /DNA_START=30 /DNA_END=1202 /DNA_ORIENTATION=-